MSNYIELSDILHIKSVTEQMKEYTFRINSECSIVTPLYIKKKNDKAYPVFCMLSKKIVSNIEKIIDNSSYCVATMVEKPKGNVHYLMYVNNLFQDELIATNEIEGVASSRKEIGDAKKSKNHRFHFLVKKYGNLMDDFNKIKLENPKDIRIIYDDLLTNEIEESQLPDGRLFRKDGVTVKSRSNPTKTVHEGCVPETLVEANLQTLLDYVNQDNSLYIIKIAIAHYYFGYIHPFYDGNGRIGRFLSSYLLIKNSISPLIAFKLSKKIKENIVKYDSGFISANNIKNMGDATLFVEMFTSVLVEASNEVVSDLNLIEYEQKKARLYINELELKNDTEKNILYIIFQASHYGNNLTTKVISENLQIDQQTIRKYVKHLIEKKLVKRAGHNLYLEDEIVDEIDLY